MTTIVNIGITNDHEPQAKEIADIFHKAGYNLNYIQITKEEKQK